MCRFQIRVPAGLTFLVSVGRAAGPAASGATEKCHGPKGVTVARSAGADRSSDSIIRRVQRGLGGDRADADEHVSFHVVGLEGLVVKAGGGVGEWYTVAFDDGGVAGCLEGFEGGSKRLKLWARLAAVVPLTATSCTVTSSTVVAQARDPR